MRSSQPGISENLPREQARTVFAHNELDDTQSLEHMFFSSYESGQWQRHPQSG